jgi:hypothetical protein
MNPVGIEYEKKFVEQCNKDIRYVQKTDRNRILGRALCIQGDARNLSCLNTSKVNSIVTSPPSAPYSVHDRRTQRSHDTQQPSNNHAESRKYIAWCQPNRHDSTYYCAGNSANYSTGSKPPHKRAPIWSSRHIVHFNSTLCAVPICRSTAAFLTAQMNQTCWGYRQSGFNAKLEASDESCSRRGWRAFSRSATRSTRMTSSSN